MKHLKKLIISSLILLGSLGVFLNTNVHAASGYQGFVGYRDGVVGGNWHAGIFISTAGARDNAANLVEAVGPGYVVQECSYSLFMGSSSNVYRKTGYKQNATSAQRDNIVSTARYLASMGSISYSTYFLIDYKPGTGNIIYPGNVASSRCDGVSEYCYEFNGFVLQGSPWDISTTAGAPYHNTVYMTPTTQASIMDSY